MKKLLSLSLLALMCASVFAQQVVLTFTGRDADNHFLPLSRVVIGNQTRGWQETIYYPDTTLSFGATGISDYAANGSFGLAQNNPNPFNGTTDVNLTVTEPGAVTMEIADVNGKIGETYGRASLQPGTHQFRINVANAGVYFLTARQNGKTSSVKMVNNGNGAGNGIEYVGTVGTVCTPVETVCTPSLPTKNGEKGHTDNPFSIGDEMVYIGYAIVNGTEYASQTIHQNQLVSETFVLNFNVTYVEPTGLATVTTDTVSDITGSSAICTGTVVDDGGDSVIARGICWSTSHNPVFNDSHVSGGDGLGSFSCQLTGLTPNTTYYARAYAVNTSGTAYGNEVEFTITFTCGTSTISDIDGNTYNTVQIGNQCWMKENLKTTQYADGTPIENGSTTSYDIAYWYYPNNEEANKATYGLLYNWKAVMRNSSSSSSDPSNVQGICPDGWHVPSDAEWTQLTDYVSSQSEYVCGSDNTYNIAKALAGTTGWWSSSNTCAVGNTPSNNNATGFSALPAGFYSSSYDAFGGSANFWSATGCSSDGAYSHYLFCDNAGVGRNCNGKSYGFSVRCVRDVETAPVTDTIAFVPNGGIGAPDTTLVERGEEVTVPTNTYTHDGNWQFAGWNTEANGSGTPYAANATFTANGNITLFAQWNTWCDGTPQANESGTSRIDSVKDVDNNQYAVVQIGNQCWMRENLRTDVQGNNGYPNGNANNWEYGRLYSWDVMMNGAPSSNANPSNVQGICPDGWHVPSDAEWTQLTDYVSSQSEYVCGSNNTYIAKALAGATGWSSSTNTCAVGNTPSNNNATGFSALPAGSYSGSYHQFGNYANFCSATENSSDSAYTRNLNYHHPGVYLGNANKTYGFSVRCVRD